MMKKIPPFSFRHLQFVLFLLLVLSISCSKKDDPVAENTSNTTQEDTASDEENSATDETANALPVPDIRRGVNTLSILDQLSTSNDLPVPMEFCVDGIIDSDGNHICVGLSNRFSDLNLELDDDPDFEGFFSKSDIFLMKTNPSGKVLWHFKGDAGSFKKQYKDKTTLTLKTGVSTLELNDIITDGHDECVDVQVDLDNNIYCLFSTTEINQKGSVIADKNIVVENSGTTTSGIIKFSPDGELLWARQIGANLHGLSNSEINTLRSSNFFDLTTHIVSIGNFVEIKEIRVVEDKVFAVGVSNSSFGANSDGTKFISFLIEYDTQGSLLNLLQVKNSNYKISGIKKSPYSESYFLYGQGKEEVNGDNLPLVIRLDEKFNIGWVQNFESNIIESWRDEASANIAYCRDLLIDSDEGTYCAGQTKVMLGNNDLGTKLESDTDLFVAKLNYQGFVQDIYQLTEGYQNPSSNFVTRTNAPEYFVDMVIYNDDLYILGNTRGSLGAENQKVVESFEPYALDTEPGAPNELVLLQLSKNNFEVKSLIQLGKEHFSKFTDFSSTALNVWEDKFYITGFSSIPNGEFCTKDLFKEKAEGEGTNVGSLQYGNIGVIFELNSYIDGTFKNIQCPETLNYQLFLDKVPEFIVED